METMGAAADFRRVFGGALILHLVGASVPYNLGDAIIGSLIVAATLSVWASKAPRGAAIALAVLAALGTLGTFVVAIRAQTWWWLGFVTLDSAALLMALRAIDPARACVADRERRENAARDWENKHRWDRETGR